MDDTPGADNELAGNSFLLDRFQQLFSLFQVRLVGAILLLYFLLRCALLLALNPVIDPFMRLSQLSTLANIAILLPVGCALYLLGSGFRRKLVERILLKVLFPLLLPLSIGIGLLLPLAIILCSYPLQQQQQVAERTSLAMLDDHRKWEMRMEEATNAASARELVDSLKISVPVEPNDPMSLVQWRFSQALKQRHDELIEKTPLAHLTPYQQDLLSKGQLITVITSAVFSGLSLLMLYLQGRNRIRRYHLNPGAFLTAESVQPRHRKH